MEIIIVTKTPQMTINTVEVSGFKGAIYGMRNPLNSWDKSDSFETINGENEVTYKIGPNDMILAQRLIKSGSEHCKFLRMIHVQANVDMPRYLWSELDTYHFGTKNSCSTMHRLLNNSNPITKEMFVTCEEDDTWWDLTIQKLESLRMEYKNTSDNNEKDRLLVRAKRMLPEGFLQLRTWDTNYAELRNIYFQRRHHRLHEEWGDVICGWIDSLLYADELITFTG